ncbi:MAG: hypothetical protein ACTHLZ_18695 [Tepidisphaeraceae bacterium]
MPTVWQQTGPSGQAYNLTPPRMLQAFMSREQIARMERIRQARMIYRGLHRDYFLGEGRTQFDFPLSTVNGKDVQLYVGFNVLRLISRKHADLLFGEEPIITVDDDEARQTEIKQLVEQSRLHVRLYSAACSCSWAAEAFLESVLINGEAYIRPIPADEMMPIGLMLPDGQYAQYVRQRLHNFGTEKEPTWALLEETYSAGSIDRQAWKLNPDGEKVAQFDVATWPVAPGTPSLSPKTVTGISRNTVTWFQNEDEEGNTCSDYDGGLIGLQDALNSKVTQIARVLAKHSDPKLALPPGGADENGQIASTQNLFYFNSKEEIPQYIVWNAELQSALQDKKETLNALTITAEMSQSLLGLKEGAAPDSARKLKLEAVNALAKAARKAALFKPSMRRVVSVSLELQANLAYAGIDPSGASILLPSGRAAEIGDGADIGVEMRDGLPRDELDEAQIVQTYRSSGTMSIEDGVERRKPDLASRELEVARIKAESAANVPSVLLHEPGTASETTSEPPAAEAA